MRPAYCAEMDVTRGDLNYLAAAHLALKLQATRAIVIAGKIGIHCYYYCSALCHCLSRRVSFRVDAVEDGDVWSTLIL